MRLLFVTALFVSIFLVLARCDDAGDDSDSDSDSSEHGVIATDVSNNCTCGWANKDDQRIVGGKATKVNEYPMIAGFMYYHKDMIMCGGTIITKRHILTAGHCTQPFNPSDIGVFVGHHNFVQVRASTTLLRPERFYVHEKYDSFTLKYDVAIVYMKDEILFNRNVGPACLPATRTDLTGQLVKVLGWGLTKYKGKTSDVLMQVNVYMQPFEMCEEKNMHLELEDRHQLCTFRKNKDSCSGDSGGPVMWVDPATNRYTLVGATSYGINCAKYPAVVSDVYYFLPWIQSVISKSDPTMKTCAKV
uniref:Venom S1 protease 20 n=1 Tax=Oncocephalus sp. TaxID=2944721 RepID=A0AB38ZEK9_9HEMI